MNKRILCIDERLEILDLVRNILEDEGYETLLRRTPFQKMTEIEVLHPDLILLTVTAFANCLGRQTLRMLNLKPETACFPILVLFREVEDFLPEDQNLIGKHIFFVRSSLDVTAFVNSIQQALHTSPEPT